MESGKNFSAEQKKSERCPLLYEWHKKQYVGAAHGMAGIYYLLLQVRGGGARPRRHLLLLLRLAKLSVLVQPGANVHPDVLSELVRPSVDYIRHKRFRSGNFPSSLSNESDRLVHWCHGAPGVIHMLLMAHQVCAPP